MSINYFITNLLNIKEDNVTFLDGIHHELIKDVKYSVINAKLSYSGEACPVCGCNEEGMIIKYGFKSSLVRFSKALDYPVLLDLKKQKLFCKSCGHYFLVESKIVDKYCSISNQLKKSILYGLTKKVSMKDVACDNYVSVASVLRVLSRFDNYFNVDFRSLPKNLCFDEFKSTKDAKGSMSFIYCDADSHDVVDIVENRQLPFLRRYFSSYPKSVRDKVESICIDMYSPYVSLIKEMFVNAKIVVDRFHIVKLFSSSFNQTRINSMKSFSSYSFEYKRLKKYWRLFLKPHMLLRSSNLLKWIHFPDRYISELDVVDESISVDRILESSYICYQCIRDDIEKKDFESFKKHLIYFKDKVSTKMQVSINTCFEYLDFIKNSFIYEYSNGPIEGINNFIKVIKRIAFGFKSFVNFRTRIFICRNLVLRI